MQGTVISAKTAKTVTVTVVSQWKHPVYGKYVKSTKKYACHIDKVEAKEGDIVTITECRPISKTKFFVVTAKAASTKATIAAEAMKESADKAEVKEAPKAKVKKTK